jgi:hypothetical protein
LPEDAFRHLGGVANLHSILAWFELGQFVYHGVDRWTHGFKNKALVEAVWAFVLKLCEKLSDMPNPILGGNLGEMVQDA